MGQQIRGQCALCLQQDSLLQQSHIIPDFFFRRIKKEGKHIKVTRESEASAYISEYSQDSCYEPLLCWQCEQSIRQWEEYASELLFSSKKLNTKSHNARHKKILKGIDYHKFKLFQESILWRASVANGDAFANVSLEDTDKEALRKSLHTEKELSWNEYGGHIIQMFDKKANLPTDKLILLPSYESYEFQARGVFQYARLNTFTFGGYRWNFYTPSESLPEEIQQYFLKENGSLRIQRCSVWQIPSTTTALLGMLTGIKRGRKLKKELNSFLDEKLKSRKKT